MKANRRTLNGRPLPQNRALTDEQVEQLRKDLRDNIVQIGENRIPIFGRYGRIVGYEIRPVYGKKRKLQDIAKDYNISPSTLSNIKDERIYI